MNSSSRTAPGFACDFDPLNWRSNPVVTPTSESSLQSPFAENSNHNVAKKQQLQPQQQQEQSEGGEEVALTKPKRVSWILPLTTMLHGLSEHVARTLHFIAFADLSSSLSTDAYRYVLPDKICNQTLPGERHGIGRVGTKPSQCSMPDP